MLRFTPFFPGLWRSSDCVLGHLGLAHGFAHRRIGRLPLPLDAVQSLASEQQLVPDIVEDAQGAPGLEMPMHGAVVAKLLGQLVPLTARAKPVEDTVQDRTQRHALSIPRVLGILAFQNPRDDLPDIVRNAPDGGFWLRFVRNRHAMISCEWTSQTPSAAATG